MKPILDVKGTVTSSSSKTHIIYHLHISKEIQGMHVEFSYEPMQLDDKEKSKPLIVEALQQYVTEDVRKVYIDNWEANHPLKNLLTLSFDDVNGFRGAAHRYGTPGEKLILSADEASPGFMAGPIPCGLFRVTVSVHCIVTEECHYTLKITEGGCP